MQVKAMDLFEAYSKNQLPQEHGYIVSAFFSEASSYTRYEVISYNNVKAIYPTEEGLTFQSDGKKLFILVEPPNYPHKSEEPFVRKSAEQIPHRFNELEKYECKNQVRVYFGKNAVFSHTNFTILKPTGVNFSFLFFDLPDLPQTLEMFFAKTLANEAAVPTFDAKRVAKLIAEKVKTALSWEWATG